MQKLSQRDDRWKNILLGTSTGTIGNFGCTITCIAMLAGTTPDVVNEKLKNVAGFANKNLVIWSKIKEALPNLEFEWRGYSYDNERVKKAIEDYGGCLVEVSGKRIGGEKHWVLFIGDGKMIDPWTGVEKSTSWYGDPTGYSIIKKSGNLNDPLQECLKQHAGLIDQLEAEKANHEETRGEVTKYKEEARNRKQELANFITLLSKKLVLPTTSDQADILGGVERLLEVEDNLTNKIGQMEKDHAKALTELNQKFKVMETALGEKEGQIKTLREQFEEIKKQAQAVKDKKQALDSLDLGRVVKKAKSRFSLLVSWLKSKLNGGKDGKTN